MKNFVTILCVTIGLGLSALPLSAQQVTREVAMEKAIRFLHKPEEANSNMRHILRKAPQLVLANNRDEFYVFNDEANGGYVVVSGDERMPDVLGYSYDGHFDNDHIPCNIKALLEAYAEQVTHLRANQQVDVKKTADYDASWKPISPMIECTWGHWTPYNNQCPEIDGQHTASGCVAIAMAQIMYYHQWPKQTTDIIPGYTTETLGIEVPDIPITTIDWDNMISYYDPYNPQKYSKKQADAVASLMKLCNVAVKMNYGLENSGAYLSDTPNALWNYFGYDSLIEDLEGDDFEADEWNQIVYEELSNGRPVMCANPGHAFVIDGYDKEGYFHMNFGEHDKVSQEDGYFLLADRVVYEIIIGIQPSEPNRPQAYAALDKGKMTFYYDTEKANRSGEVFPNVSSCASNNAEIKECEFDSSFAHLNLKNLKYFFANCTNLESITGINHLNTSEVRNMCEMFYGCSSLKSLDLSGFNTEKVLNMEGMFRDCSSLRSLDISNFDTKKVTNMMNMFYYCSSLTSLDVSSFNTENVEDMDGLFYDCSSLKVLDVSKFNTEKVTDMSLMFQGCTSLSSLDVSSFKTEKVTRMSGMFGSCTNLKSLDVSSFKTGNVQDMSRMFFDCSSLTSLDVSNFNTENVENMYQLFAGCSSLKALDVSKFKTDKVTSMERMFGWCSGLTSLDLSGFKTDKVTNMDWMFYGNEKLTTIYASDQWDMSNVENSDEMFYFCTSLVGGAGTAYDWNHSDGKYAHIDEGSNNPGYLTNIEETAIHSIKTNETNGHIYNLGGIRISSDSKGLNHLEQGLYIVNGKKIIK